MKCKHVHPFLPMVGKSLEGDVAQSVSSHLDGCSECRAALKKTQRLQAVIGLKRHEKPDEFFMRQFLPDFHRRLYTELVQKASFWDRVQDLVSRCKEGMAGRLAYGGAVAALTFTLYFAYFQAGRPVPSMAPATASIEVASVDATIVNVDSRFNELVMTGGKSGPGAVYVLDRVSYQPSSHGAAVLEF